MSTEISVKIEDLKKEGWEIKERATKSTTINAHTAAISRRGPVLDSV